MWLPSVKILFMPKESFVRKQDGTTLRLGDIKAPLQKKAMELDRSLNWIVCKMLSEHPYLSQYLENKKNKK